MVCLGRWHGWSEGPHPPRLPRPPPPPPPAVGAPPREGPATLVSAVRSRKGFVLLTGEVGTGKTTLLHSLLSQLDRETLAAFIFNPRLDPLDFLRMLVDEL